SLLSSGSLTSLWLRLSGRRLFSMITCHGLLTYLNRHKQRAAITRPDHRLKHAIAQDRVGPTILAARLIAVLQLRHIPHHQAAIASDGLGRFIDKALWALLFIVAATSAQSRQIRVALVAVAVVARHIEISVVATAIVAELAVRWL